MQINHFDIATVASDSQTRCTGRVLQHTLNQYHAPPPLGHIFLMHPGSSRWWIKHLGPGLSHGRPWGNSGLPDLGLAQPCLEHMKSEIMDGPLFAFQINKGNK